MRIHVTRKEEISCIIEHQEDEFYELNDQICLVPQNAIDELFVFVGSYEVQ